MEPGQTGDEGTDGPEGHPEKQACRSLSSFSVKGAFGPSRGKGKAPACADTVCVAGSRVQHTSRTPGAGHLLTHQRTPSICSQSKINQRPSPSRTRALCSASFITCLPPA